MTISQEKTKHYHKSQLYRLLCEILDNKKLNQSIYFKGDTCCSMLNYLDRFSVDLDFDLSRKANKDILRKELHLIFKTLNLTLKDESKKALQFFLKYQSPYKQRNSIKLEIIDNPFRSIDYAPQYLEDINRTALCQTIESMFANKLVALTDRYKKRETIAGRDIYDIHYFFTHGYSYKKEVIQERTNKKTLNYLEELVMFIKQKITQRIIDEDLNFLLSPKQFRAIRKTLKTDTLRLLREEINSLKNS